METRLFNESEYRIISEIGELVFVNPFSPERVELERQLLGPGFAAYGAVWNRFADAPESRRNIQELHELARKWALEARRRLANADLSQVSSQEFEKYWRVVMYYLFEQYRKPLVHLLKQDNSRNFAEHRKFREDFHYFLNPTQNAFQFYSCERTIAIFFQIHRAFHHIYEFLIGGSEAAGKLRSSVWQSIFSYDLERYNRALFDRMNNITTLITGESGTGKEVAARAIAFSQYIPFDPARGEFVYEYKECFHPLHLSAMPAPLVESELFGHRQGAFTGALEDRAGHLERCSEFGTVFLDEIGEIPPEIQVKLLRILQTRRFSRIGESAEREFKGKVIAATNRNLSAAIREGAFRKDLYFRICADRINTVPLREILGGRRAELENFIRLLLERLLGESEAENFTPTAAAWIEEHLTNRYNWPGNVRELEQCLRNLLIRRTYTPDEANFAPGSDTDWLQAARAGKLNADELLSAYCRHVFSGLGNYSAVGIKLGLDRRTVRRYCEKTSAENEYDEKTTDL